LSEQKKVSAIVVNWNGIKFLPVCLDSLFKQTYENLEVIVVDCASKDESVPFIKSNYPKAKVIELKQDFGPPYAINLAAREAKGEYILILNNDVYLPENLVTEMAEELEKDESCVINPTELSFEHKYVRSGWPAWMGKYLYKIFKLKGENPFLPSTACCLTTKNLMFTNPLNEELFMYEDMEWGWRLHLTKMKIKVMPNSFFLHKGCGTKLKYSPEQAFYLGRVTLATCFICFRLTTFILILPLLAFESIRTILRLLRRRSLKSIKPFIEGMINFIAKMRTFAKIREVVQSQRLIGDFEVLKLMIGSANYESEAKKNWLLSASLHKSHRSGLLLRTQEMDGKAQLVHR
jgi:GT2 family glycosyltransferase